MLVIGSAKLADCEATDCMSYDVMPKALTGNADLRLSCRLTPIPECHCYLLNALQAAARPAGCDSPRQQLAAYAENVLATAGCHAEAATTAQALMNRSQLRASCQLVLAAAVAIR